MSLPFVNQSGRTYPEKFHAQEEIMIALSAAMAILSVDSECPTKPHSIFFCRSMASHEWESSGLCARRHVTNDPGS
jgi:hypothetical protein